MGLALAWRVSPAAALAVTFAALALTDARAVAGLPVRGRASPALFLAVALFAATGAPHRPRGWSPPRSWAGAQLFRLSLCPPPSPC